MTEEVTPKKPRRKRRSKAEIEAEKAAKAAEAAEIAEKEAEGFERVRARDDEGRFVQDDPETPEDEAWEWKEKEVESTLESSYEEEIDEVIEEEEEERCIPCEENAAAALEAVEAQLEKIEEEVTASWREPVEEEDATPAQPAIIEEHRNRRRFGLGKVKARMEAARNRTRPN